MRTTTLLKPRRTYQDDLPSLSKRLIPVRSEENRVKVDALVKRIQFGETNTTTVLEPRYQEVVKAARRKSPVGGDTSPSLGQKVRKEREITAGIVEKGERAMVSQEGLLRGKEAVGKGKDGVVVVEMPPRLDVGGLDKVDGKLRVVQKGVKRMTEAMG